jgi:hypothetical protein
MAEEPVPSVCSPSLPHRRTDIILHRRKALQDHVQRRNVGVYGSITMRSDGAHLEISFRLEKARGKQLWQIYTLRHDPQHGWVHVDSGEH